MTPKAAAECFPEILIYLQRSYRSAFDPYRWLSVYLPSVSSRCRNSFTEKAFLNESPATRLTIFQTWPRSNRASKSLVLSSSARVDSTLSMKASTGKLCH